MKTLHARIASFLLLAGAAVALPAAAEDLGRVPAPFDWSHRHIVFSKPATPAEAIRDGTYDQWVKDYRDPRFVLALQRRLESEADQRAPAPAPLAKATVAKATRAGAMEPASPRPSLRPPTEYPVSPRVSPPHRDWNIAMGGGAGVGSAGIFPAKYNFDISAAPSCTNDFVIYPATSAGVTGSGTRASRTGTASNNSTSLGAGTITITNGTRVLTLTSDASLNTGLNFLQTGTADQKTANITAAINRNGALVGVTAAVTAARTITVTAGTHGTGGNAITLAETIANFSWAGASLQSGAGTAGQATIFAVNNLYLACRSGTVGNPMVMWAYNTGGVVDLSPVISLDGTQVLFMQRSGAVANLVILKWAASATTTIGNPIAPTSVAAASYRACVAPCMTSITLSGSPNNTNSSPYYYYDTDELWVGDDAGVLHKFTNIFLSGTPTEVTTGGWPVTVDAGFTLSSPVYDRVSNLIYVGTNRTPDTPALGGTPHGGRLHSVNNATVAVLASAQLAGVVAATNSGSVGVAEAVIVDQLARRVYAFVGTDTTAAAAPCNANNASVECHAVYQFNGDASISGSTGLAKATFGRGQILSRVGYAGVFDNTYYTSANPASPSGFLYVCGSASSGATSRQPTLWRIPITSNALGAAVVGPTLVGLDTADNSGGGGTCSPITDVQNGANNYIFVSVPEQGNRTGCTGACMYMFNLTGIAWSAATNATAGLAAPGGTSGIVIDNISGTSGASQIYYSTLTSPGGAIQASQAALN